MSTAIAADLFSYCETVTAGPSTPWHIRLRGQGAPLLPGGGISGPAACGRDLAGGWDIPGRGVSTTDLASLDAAVCQRCADSFRFFTARSEPIRPSQPLGAYCRHCGSADTWIEWRVEARPLGSYSLAGAQVKASAREWPYAACGECGHVSRGEPSEPVGANR